MLCLIPIAAQAREAKQDARIEHLISTVESYKGAVFIRNGTEYDTKAAASHLRMKLGKAGDKVKTAEDFISGIASKSSISGKAYKIRKPDGTLSIPSFTSMQGSRNTTTRTPEAGISGKFPFALKIPAEHPASPRDRRRLPPRPENPVLP